MPQNPKEMFNMRHTKACNLIERVFAVLKMRWDILHSAAFYHVKVQIWIIMTCFLLHNFIRSEMESDLIEQALDGNDRVHVAAHEDKGIEFVDGVEPTSEWNQQREDMALMMWNYVRMQPHLTFITDSIICLCDVEFFYSSETCLCFIVLCLPIVIICCFVFMLRDMWLGHEDERLVPDCRGGGGKCRYSVRVRLRNTPGDSTTNFHAGKNTITHFYGVMTTTLIRLNFAWF